MATFKWASRINGEYYDLRLNVVMDDGEKCGCLFEISFKSLKDHKRIREYKMGMIMELAQLIADKYEPNEDVRFSTDIRFRRGANGVLGRY